MRPRGSTQQEPEFATSNAKSQQKPDKAGSPSPKYANRGSCKAPVTWDVFSAGKPWGFVTCLTWAPELAAQTGGAKPWQHSQRQHHSCFVRAVQVTLDGNKSAQLPDTSSTAQCRAAFVTKLEVTITRSLLQAPRRWLEGGRVAGSQGCCHCPRAEEELLNVP